MPDITLHSLNNAPLWSIGSACILTAWPNLTDCKSAKVLLTPPILICVLVPGKSASFTITFTGNTVAVIPRFPVFTFSVLTPSAILAAGVSLLPSGLGTIV